ncbi:hypothetical protein [Mycobacterium sp. MYCO198283]|uniref:hypothetical protein n=1 Tax=Mycobacterium sp. MYCO198283 TaxID=2883505 RepID=UPI0035AB8312
MRGIVGVIVLVWLLVGVVAVFALDQEKNAKNCTGVVNVAVTTIAGPLNFVPGLIPVVDNCPKAPEPQRAP